MASVVALNGFAVATLVVTYELQVVETRARASSRARWMGWATRQRPS